MSQHYVAVQVAVDRNWVERAKRAGTLDGFHGYPQQDHEGKAPEEQAAYKAAYTEGAQERRA